MLRKFDINSVYICPPYLYTAATLRWEIQKSHFSTVLFIRTSDYLRYRRRKQTVTPSPDDVSAFDWIRDPFECELTDLTGREQEHCAYS